MNKQAEGNKGAAGRFLQIIRSSSRAVLHGQCVFMPGALLKTSQNKNEESGEGWRFPKEILPDLDSSVFVEYNERRRQHNFAAALTINNTFRVFHALLHFVDFCL